MKKLLCLVLVMMMSLSFAMAEELGGEDFRLRGYTDGTLAVDSIYMDPHDGPGYEYYPVSLSLSKGATVRVLTQATDRQGNRWVLIESGNIRAYLIQQDSQGHKLINCNLSSVPVEPRELISTWVCRLYEDTRLLYGPGSSYQKSPFTAKGSDFGYVILMNGDWALVEFQFDYDAFWLGEGRKTRGWMIFSKLQY